MNNQLYMVDGKWMNRERMEKARGLCKCDKKKEVVGTNTTTDTVTETYTVEQLKSMCDDKNIQYHHASGIPKLKELLNLN